METYNKCLLKVPVFADLDVNMLAEISKYIEPIHYEANEIIYHEGELIDVLGIIHSGSVKLLTANEAGKHRIVRILLSGDYFGETSLLTSQKTEYDIQAIEDTCVHNIKLDSFRKLMKDDQNMTFSILQSLIDQISIRDEEVVKTSLIPAYKRVYDTLLHYSDNAGLVYLPISKQDLANSLGITAETFSRSLNKLEKEGKIKRDKNDIYII